MSINLTQIQNHFKVIGKMIFVSQLAPVDVLAYEKAMMGTVAQAISGEASEFGLANDVLVPMLASVKATVNSLNNVPGQTKSSLDKYLRNIVSVDLGLTASASAATVADELADAMDDENATVGASGVAPSGFAVYFFDNYDVTLPQDGSPNVHDAWIDDDVVED